ncbi:hypothetical protein K5E_22120 [Enterococcus thailandicus]|uniref:LysM peptidoglycan-binding domain-containing protein n=1 Tax=Enterococcus thailandicus TaxID=417368 RepID=UPI00244D7FED|nr:LysM domain-containing protein [Enterococcus thailandicus]GMC02547.1 hypothetical protein K4E_00570 [Enterococcus thailandicus]GMC10073.1 hypothetical protein K5E_22120 [Enterococcus thailandicus]
MKLLKVLAVGVTVGGIALAINNETASAAEWTPRTVDQIKADIKGNEYTIVWGDTLSGISQATNISVQKLADMNKIANVDLIFVGNKLVFEGNVATLQNSAGETVAQTVIEDSDKVNPTQPIGNPAVSADTSADNSTNQVETPSAPTVDDGANQQPVTPSTPSDNGNQGGTDNSNPDQNQGGDNNQGNNENNENNGNNGNDGNQGNNNNNNGENNGENGGEVNPPQPVEKWTVWYTASDEEDASYNLEKGVKVFDSEEEATAWIDSYADGLLVQGITSNSYGVSSFLVQQ